MMNVRIDRSLIRANGNSKRYVLVDVTAPEVSPREGRIPVNVALVLDRSGSMHGEKIATAREAAIQAIRLLRPEDRFSVVIYDDVVDVLVASTHATAEAREEAVRLVRQVEPRSATDLSTGWLTGCEQVAGHLREEAVGKVLLLSDGLANRGIRDRAELERHANVLRARGVLTSTFGIGAGFDERLMETLATAGGGNSYFIEEPRQIPDLLASELGETLEVVARDVEIFVGVPEGARTELLHTYTAVQEPRGVRCKLGNLVSGQQIAALFAVWFPRGTEGVEAVVDATLIDRDGVLGTPTRGLTVRYAGTTDNDRQPRDLEVDRVVAGIYAERARREALETNRAGDYENARHTLLAAAERIARYAGNDAVMVATIQRLRQDEHEFSRRMDATSSKRHYYSSERSLKSRGADSKARRAGRPPGEEYYPLDTSTGHPVADIGGVRCLIDTGSPATFGRSGFRVLGDDHRPDAGLGGVNADEISRLVGTRVDVLVGMDVLARYPWVLDWDRARVSFLRTPEGVFGRRVPAALRHGVPTIEIDATDRRHPGAAGAGTRLAFVDTSAKLSYMDPDDLGGARACGEEQDFFPLVGQFRVPVYRRTITLAGEPFRGTFGILPDAMGMILGMAGVKWILGSEVLRRGPVLFDLTNGLIVFCG
jgi:Ca-activated chloride channel family protein